MLHKIKEYVYVFDTIKRVVSVSYMLYKEHMSCDIVCHGTLYTMFFQNNVF